MTRVTTIALIVIVAHTMLMVGTVEAAEPRHDDPSMRSPAAEFSLASSGYDSPCLTVHVLATASSAPLPASIECMPVRSYGVAGYSSPLECFRSSTRHPPDVIRALLQVYRI